jgi:GntR family transcriptional regulator, phosphonate transport system regulatory protein
MIAADVERRSGIALWRQIADRIRVEIDAGAFEGKLSPEHELARRFGVNRHTVREAIASLVREGVLRSEQGRGTFIEARRRFAYPIGVRTRFSEGLGGQARELHGKLIEHAYAQASDQVAAALDLAAGASVLRLETLGEADGQPISRATGYFDAVRFPAFEAAYARTGSITASFKEFGVDDYFRRSTLISARHAVASDLADLGLSPGAIVLVTVAINEDIGGTPVQFSEARFAASRIEFSVSGHP